MNESYKETNIRCIFECAKAIIGSENYNYEQLVNIELYFKVLNVPFNNGTFEDIDKILADFFNYKLSNIFVDTNNDDTLVKMLYLSIIIHILKPKRSNTMELCSKLPKQSHAIASAIFAPIILSYISGDLITANDLDKCINNNSEIQTGLFKAEHSPKDQCVFKKQKQLKNQITIQFKAFIDSLSQEDFEYTSFEQLVKYVQSQFYKNSELITKFSKYKIDFGNWMTCSTNLKQLNANQMKENVEPQSICPEDNDDNSQTDKTQRKRNLQDEESDTDIIPPKKNRQKPGSSIYTINQPFHALHDGLLSLISDNKKCLIKNNKELAEQTQIIKEGRCFCENHAIDSKKLKQKIDELEQKENDFTNLQNHLARINEHFFLNVGINKKIKSELLETNLKIATLNTNIDTMKKNEAKLNEINKELEINLLDRESKLSEANENNKSMLDIISNKDSQLADKDSQLEDKESEILELKKDNALKDETIDEVSK